jgi:hypothetical protein
MAAPVLAAIELGRAAYAGAAPPELRAEMARQINRSLRHA